ncbi:MAG TPA: dTMP kinase [Myxococcota bacterium]|nr:dTMP kinase [Myxococcota bacterium]
MNLEQSPERKRSAQRAEGERSERAGRLIVFEGTDGSGKSTQLPRLAEHLEAAGLRVVRTREPYDCPAGRAIRAMARSGERIAPEQELVWFYEQRRAHVREVVRPALARGDVVLSDRYFVSTAAYQGARGLDAAAILATSEVEFPVPDLVLWLDLPVAAGLARTHARGAPHEPAFEDAAFLERVRETMGSLARDYIVRIDASGTADQVAACVAAVVEEQLGLPRG